MEVGSVTNMQNMMPAYQAGASGDNEAVERVPDNEQAEMATKSAPSSSGDQSYSLSPWQGTAVNIMA
tara:strand:- start:464 stop:664 length:201 start_codon:yes stop_codon:yes gene_type:complete